MLIFAIILFIIAAIFGIVMFTALLEERYNSNKTVLLHGIIAITALVLVFVYALLSGFSRPLVASLILFTIAALGGLTLVSFGLKKKPVPKLLVILHPLIAIAGLIVLIAYVLP